MSVQIQAAGVTQLFVPMQIQAFGVTQLFVACGELNGPFVSRVQEVGRYESRRKDMK